ncbi:hypothetical protein ACI2LF_25030 [Kribbella sp. NPDC020789]
MTVPVISITDLYHPPEDPGGVLGLILAFGLPEIDLRAVILDRSTAHLSGARDPGVVAMIQLNAIFGRHVPFARGPVAPMREPNDSMYDAPPARQRSIELLVQALADSPEPVHLLSFGSARPIAVAYNRAPEVFHQHVARIHLSGTADPQAVDRLVGSGLPLSTVPAATCTLPDLKWIEDLHPWLRRYVGYALGGLERPDLLRALEEEAPAAVMADIYQRSCPAREFGVWMEVTGRIPVRRTDGSHAFVPADRKLPGDRVACSEQALAEALPALYQSFRPCGLS